MPSKSLLSLITAIRKGREDYLIAETAENLLEQRLPTGWILEWLIQEDGEDPALEGIEPVFKLSTFMADSQVPVPPGW